METAELRMPAFADHLAVTNHDGTDERIGANPPATALRELQCPLEVFAIRGCQLGIHKLIDSSVNKSIHEVPTAPPRNTLTPREADHPDPLPE